MEAGDRCWGGDWVCVLSGGRGECHRRCRIGKRAFGVLDEAVSKRGMVLLSVDDILLLGDSFPYLRLFNIQ